MGPLPMHGLIDLRFYNVRMLVRIVIPNNVSVDRRLRFALGNNASVSDN